MATRKTMGAVGKGGVNPAPVPDSSTVRVAAEQLVMMSIDELIPYANNARVHSAEQIRQLRGSLREFGFVMPVLVDLDGNIIAGHGRIISAKEEGMSEVPCVMVSNLSEAQRKAYILADNRLCERGSWDEDLLRVEIEGLKGMDFDFQLTGFTMDDVAELFSGEHEKAVKPRPDGDTPEDYEAFLDKFQAKHTTDDCYTPSNIYDAVADYCAERYGIDRDSMVRPFYPGGDYQSYAYGPDQVVVDNPPFSILSEIVKWFNEHGVRFFLFAPATSLLGRDCTAVAAYATITYANGAVVNTSFLTNMEPGCKLRTAPDLSAILREVDDANAKEGHREIGNYEYPDQVLTAAMAGKYSHYGVDLAVGSEQCCFIRALDQQKDAGKAIFGGGLLLSKKAAAEKAAAEKAAAEKAAAEKAAAVKWSLSDREIGIVRSLGGNE